MSEVYEVLQHNRVKLQIVRFLMFFFLIEKLLKTTSWVFEDHVCLQLTLTLVTTVNAKKNANWVRDEEPTFLYKSNICKWLEGGGWLGQGNEMPSVMECSLA